MVVWMAEDRVIAPIPGLSNRPAPPFIRFISMGFSFPPPAADGRESGQRDGLCLVGGGMSAGGLNGSREESADDKPIGCAHKQRRSSG